MPKTTFQRISVRTKSLLLKQEGVDVDYKKNLKGLDNSDLVAFANSKEGGVIFIGIDENKDHHGIQKPKIIGCDVGDQEKRAITTKAASCNPPIDIEIFIENMKTKPFFRIEIKSGDNKPYCTTTGTYKIRDDGNNKGIMPQILLNMFLQSKYKEFLETFTNATVGMEEKLAYVLGSLDEISSSADSANAFAEEAQVFSDETLGIVNELHHQLVDMGGPSDDVLHEKIDALLEHLKIEQPRITQARIRVYEITERLFNQGKSKREIKKELKDYCSQALWHIMGQWCDEKLKELSK